MFIKPMAIAVGLCGAVGLSQFPEYAQQYKQRLSGAVEELSWVVAQFDADAANLGMTRSEALQNLQNSSALAQARAGSMSDVILRYERLSRDLAILNKAASIYAPRNILRFTEQKLARDTLSAFKPAIPFTLQGVLFGAVGFALGYGVWRGFFWFLNRLSRRKPLQSEVT